METKKDILNRLFIENNLTDEDVFKHKFYNIITRSGIDKIQATNDIKIKYELMFNSADLKYGRPSYRNLWRMFTTK
jgi:hypothetical protein